MGGAVGAGVYAWRIEPHWVRVVRRDLPITHLPADLVGKTLVQLSDLHVGGDVDETYLRGALGRVAELKPDIVAVTGDFMTTQDTEWIDRVIDVLGHLRRGALATIAVLGNHDYGYRWSLVPVADALSRRLSAVGFTVLRNDLTEVLGLQIAGIDDLWSPRFAPRRVMPRLDPSRGALVLCHNPDAADRPVWAGYRGWILCGHTHGGQCRVPPFGPPILPVQNRRYWAGQVDLADGRHLYVNRGLGHLRRVRFAVRPEITAFRLTRATS